MMSENLHRHVSALLSLIPSGLISHFFLFVSTKLQQFAVKPLCPSPILYVVALEPSFDLMNVLFEWIFFFFFPCQGTSAKN